MMTAGHEAMAEGQRASQASEPPLSATIPPAYALGRAYRHDWPLSHRREDFLLRAGKSDPLAGV